MFSLVLTVSSNVTIFLAALLVFAGVIIGMSVGVIFTGRRIKGSCGGLSAWKDADGRSICEACADCPEKKTTCELEDGELKESGRTVASGR